MPIQLESKEKRPKREVYRSDGKKYLHGTV